MTGSINALSDPDGAITYIFGVLALGFHLFHGASSTIQSLGIRHPKYIRLITFVGRAATVVLAGCFASIPLNLHTGKDWCADGTQRNIPSGPLEQKWDNHRNELKLVNPANKRKYTIICVGTGLAGASASASLAELGYNVLTFCIQDSPRRAHSIAAQGGINAAKNYANDGDSVYRLFYDTIKGGDYRSREANVYRLAQVSDNIIDQCVAQGVPFARDYGGMLVTRSFGGAQVSRTFYARGQTGQQLLLGRIQRDDAAGRTRARSRYSRGERCWTWL